MVRTWQTAKKQKDLEPEKNSKTESDTESVLEPELEPILQTEADQPEKEQPITVTTTAPIFEKNQSFVVPDDESPNETFKLVKVLIIVYWSLPKNGEIYHYFKRIPFRDQILLR